MSSIFGVLLCLSVEGSAQLIGPGFPPPGGASFSSAAGDNATGTGRTSTYGNLHVDAVGELYWTLRPGEARLSLDGDADGAGGPYEASEIMVFSPADSNLAAGIIAWTGSSRWCSQDTMYTVPTRLTARLTNTSGSPLPLTPASLIPGMNPAVGAVLNVPSDFQVNYLFEVRNPRNNNIYEPAKPFFDGVTGYPHCENSATYRAQLDRSIFPSFWWTSALSATHETVLIPMAVQPTPGNFGSLWRSEVWMRNDGSQAIDIFPCVSSETVVCSASSAFSLQPQTSIQNPPLPYRTPGTVPGILLYVPRASSSNVHFSNRIFDVSRAATTFGTEIPVIRESEFRTSRLHLLGVPLESQFRQALRIYEMDGRPQGDFRVAIYGVTVGTAEQLLVERLVSTTAPSEADVQSTPGYAQILDLVQAFPQLVGAQRVRVEVEPASGGLRFWAFISVTNNDTQHVTTITPQ